MPVLTHENVWDALIAPVATFFTRSTALPVAGYGMVDPDVSSSNVAASGSTLREDSREL